MENSKSCRMARTTGAAVGSYVCVLLCTWCVDSLCCTTALFALLCVAQRLHRVEVRNAVGSYRNCLNIRSYVGFFCGFKFWFSSVKSISPGRASILFAALAEQQRQQPQRVVERKRYRRAGRGRGRASLGKSMDDSVQKRISDQRARLLALDYHDPFTAESLALVERLFEDLVTTTESYEDLQQRVRDRDSTAIAPCLIPSARRREPLFVLIRVCWGAIEL